MAVYKLNEAVVDSSYLADEMFLTVEGWELPKSIQIGLRHALYIGNALDRIDILYNNYDMETIDDKTILNKVPLDPADFKELGLVDIVICPARTSTFSDKKNHYTVGIAFNFDTENRNQYLEKITHISDIDAIDYIGFIEAKGILILSDEEVEEFPQSIPLQDKFADQAASLIQMVLNANR